MVFTRTSLLQLDNKANIRDDATNNSHKIEKRPPHYSRACSESMQLDFILCGMLLMHQNQKGKCKTTKQETGSQGYQRTQEVEQSLNDRWFNSLHR